MKNWGEGVIWHENDAITGIIIFFVQGCSCVLLSVFAQIKVKKNQKWKE